MSYTIIAFSGEVQEDDANSKHKRELVHINNRHKIQVQSGGTGCAFGSHKLP
jgi:hypothetical protein